MDNKYRFRVNWRGKLILQEEREVFDPDPYQISPCYKWKDVCINLSKPKEKYSLGNLFENSDGKCQNKSKPKYKYRVTWNNKLILQEYYEDMDMDMYGFPIIDTGYRDVKIFKKVDDIVAERVKEYPLPN